MLHQHEQSQALIYNCFLKISFAKKYIEETSSVYFLGQDKDRTAYSLLQALLKSYMDKRKGHKK